MARILALDWDQKLVHVVSAQTGRGEVRIDRAVQYAENIDLSADNAADAGHRLRERLRQLGVAAGPVLVCLGRERVILKEIRYPQVPPREEPALVRFQASKDLTENADDVIIDYQPLGAGAQGEAQAMAVIVRRDVVNAYQTLCRAAGLRLVGMAPRPFGMPGAIQRATGVLLTPGPTAADVPIAVLTLGERWAELCIVKGHLVLFARSLMMGQALPGEVKRSLAVFAAGHGRSAPQVLYVAGNGEHGPLRERLHDMLGMPVHALDPFAREEHVQVTAQIRGGFTGAVGLLHQWSKRQALVINFAQPKEPRQESDPNKRRWLLAGAVAAVLLIVVFILGQDVLGREQGHLDELTKTHAAKVAQLKLLEEDGAEVAVMREFDQTLVPWLEELYDLARRMDFKEGFRITKMTMGPAPKRAELPGAKKPAAKESPYIGQINITGNVPEGQEHLVNSLISRIQQDKHCKVTRGLDNTSGDTKGFNLKIDLLKQPASAYVERLEVPSEAVAAPVRKKGGRR